MKVCAMEQAEGPPWSLGAQHQAEEEEGLPQPPGVQHQAEEEEGTTARQLLSPEATGRNQGPRLPPIEPGSQSFHEGWA